MCNKLPYENPRIDKCLIEKIKEMNLAGIKTLSSCCGHSKYPPTIIIKESPYTAIEYYTFKRLKMPKLNRFYKKDSENYYYLNPELFIKKN